MRVREPRRMRDASNRNVVTDTLHGRPTSKLLENTYRVLLTRGVKGCYVYFMGDGTHDFFESRIARH